MASIYISYGITKSASTFVWQLIKRIAIGAGLPVATLTVKSKGVNSPEDYIDPISEENLKLIRDDIGNLPVVIKTHGDVTPIVVRLVRDGEAQVFASYRDLREVALSLVDHGARSRATGIKDFAEFRNVHDTLPSLKIQIRRFEAWVHFCDPLLIPYDEVCFHTDVSISKIASRLGVPVDIDFICREFEIKKRSIGQFNKGQPRRFEGEMTREMSILFLETFNDYYIKYFPAELSKPQYWKQDDAGALTQTLLAAPAEASTVISGSKNGNDITTRSTRGPKSIDLLEKNMTVVKVDNQPKSTRPKLSREDVVYAYRLILGREPENNSVVSKAIESAQSLQEFREKLLVCPEFKAYLARQGQLFVKPLTWPRSHVDVQVSSSELALMMRHVEAAWEELGRLEPHWSVLAKEKFRAAQVGDNVEEFFESGKAQTEIMRASAARYGIRVEDYRNCLELGCGVGRVTIWLGALFPHVIAADISEPHLELAREAITLHGCQNVTLLKLRTIADLESLPEIDAFLSVIVLQHNPPPIIAQILRIILKKLRANGIGYFQVPTYQLDYRFLAKKYLDELVPGGKMEMHVLPQDVLFSLIEECGCRLLEIREDGQASAPTMISNSILVTKRTSA